MHVVQNFHHVLWTRAHWKLDGIVGGGAVFAITYSILDCAEQDNEFESLQNRARKCGPDFGAGNPQCHSGTGPVSICQFDNLWDTIDQC